MEFPKLIKIRDQSWAFPPLTSRHFSAPAVSPTYSCAYLDLLGYSVKDTRKLRGDTGFPKSGILHLAASLNTKMMKNHNLL